MYKQNDSTTTMALVLWPNPRLSVIIQLFDQFVFGVVHWMRRQLSDQWVVSVMYKLDGQSCTD